MRSSLRGKSGGGRGQESKLRSWGRSKMDTVTMLRWHLTRWMRGVQGAGEASRGTSAAAALSTLPHPSASSLSPKEE